MLMNIIDIGVVIFILFGFILGFKRGFTKEVVKGLGFIIVIVLSYLLKNHLSVFLYEHLPFFKIGILKGVEVLNILIYEVIAFIICVIILSIALKILIMVSSVFEKILNATIILGIPSKIAGGIVGIVYHYILAFVILYILTLTCFNFSMVTESKLRQNIVNNTPVLSNIVDSSVNVIEEFMSIKDKYDDKTISEKDFNYQTIEIFLKYKLLKTSPLEKLIESGKITVFDDYYTLIEKYKGE